MLFYEFYESSVHINAWSFTISPLPTYDCKQAASEYWYTRLTGELEMWVYWYITRGKEGVTIRVWQNMHHPERLGLDVNLHGNDLRFPPNTCTDWWKIVCLWWCLWPIQLVSCSECCVSHASHPCSQMQEVPRIAGVGPAPFRVGKACPLRAVFLSQLGQGEWLLTSCTLAQTCNLNWLYEVVYFFPSALGEVELDPSSFGQVKLGDFACFEKKHWNRALSSLQAGSREQTGHCKGPRVILP